MATRFLKGIFSNQEFKLLSLTSFAKQDFLQGKGKGKGRKGQRGPFVVEMPHHHHHHNHSQYRRAQTLLPKRLPVVACLSGARPIGASRPSTTIMASTPTEKEHGAASPEASVCTHCPALEGSHGIVPKACTRCKATHYYGRACQTAHLQAGHKQLCVTPKEQAPQPALIS